jgi:hypothetical protein
LKLVFFLTKFHEFCREKQFSFLIHTHNLDIIREDDKMKQVLFFLAIIFFVWACSTQKAIVKVEKTQPVVEADSIEYGVETFDSKFETWYELHKSPALNRSLDYYEDWNKQYVLAWNHKAISKNKNSFFSPIVGYHSSEEYGFEVNHKLFYYFQYVENVLGIQIMPNGPKGVVGN